MAVTSQHDHISGYYTGSHKERVPVPDQSDPFLFMNLGGIGVYDDLSTLSIIPPSQHFNTKYVGDYYLNYDQLNIYKPYTCASKFCSKNASKKCSADSDCGTEGPCSVVGGKVCSKNANKQCNADSDCGLDGYCSVLKSKVCLKDVSKKCSTDFDCIATGPCFTVSNISRTCSKNTKLQCNTDSDCGTKGGTCGTGTCENNSSKTCTSNSECDSYWIQSNWPEHIDTLTSNKSSSLLMAGVNPKGALNISTDMGNTWAKATSETGEKNWSTVASDGGGSRLLAGVYGGLLYISSDAGKDWSVTGPSVVTNQNWTAVSSSSTGKDLVAAADGGKLYLSFDYGTNWRASSTPAGDTAKWRTIAMSADGKNIIAGVNPGRLYVTYNNGQTCKPTVNTCSITGVPCSPGANGTDCTTWKEATGPWGATDQAWESVAVGIDSTTGDKKLAASVFVDCDPRLGCGSYNRLYTASAGKTCADADCTTWSTGSNWSTLTGKSWNVWSSSDGKKLIIGGTPGHLYVASNAGQTCVGAVAGTPGTCSGSNASCSVDAECTTFNQTKPVKDNPSTVKDESDVIENWQVFISPDGKRFVVGANPGRLYTGFYSSSNVINWSEASPKKDTNQNWQSIASGSNGQDVITAVNGGSLYVSNNYGVRWDQTGPSEGSEPIYQNWSASASSADGKRLIAGGSPGRLYISSNTGKSFQEIYPPGDSILCGNQSAPVIPGDLPKNTITACTSGGKCEPVPASCTTINNEPGQCVEGPAKGVLKNSQGQYIKECLARDAQGNCVKDTYYASPCDTADGGQGQCVRGGYDTNCSTSDGDHGICVKGAGGSSCKTGDGSDGGCVKAAFGKSCKTVDGKDGACLNVPLSCKTINYDNENDGIIVSVVSGAGQCIQGGLDYTCQPWYSRPLSNLYDASRGYNSDNNKSQCVTSATIHSYGTGCAQNYSTAEQCAATKPCKTVDNKDGVCVKTALCNNDQDCLPKFCNGSAQCVSGNPNAKQDLSNCSGSEVKGGAGASCNSDCGCNSNLYCNALLKCDDLAKKGTDADGPRCYNDNTCRDGATPFPSKSAYIIKSVNPDNEDFRAYDGVTIYEDGGADIKNRKPKNPYNPLQRTLTLEESNPRLTGPKTIKLSDKDIGDQFTLDGNIDINGRGVNNSLGLPEDNFDEVFASENMCLEDGYCFTGPSCKVDSDCLDSAQKCVEIDPDTEKGFCSSPCVIDSDCNQAWQNQESDIGSKDTCGEGSDFYPCTKAVEHTGKYLTILYSQNQGNACNAATSFYTNGIQNLFTDRNLLDSNRKLFRADIFRLAK